MTDWNEADDAVDGADHEPTAVETDQAQLYFGSVDEWIREFLLPISKRPINGRNRVCASRWLEYPEAVARLDAIWRTWEYLRQDPHARHERAVARPRRYHLAVLMDPDGPFANADDTPANTCRRGEPLPYEAPPPDLFPDVPTGV